MNLNLKKTLLSNLADTVKKLGVLGTISYIGAFTIFIGSLFVDFDKQTLKASILLGIGVALLIYSGVIYWLESKQETAKIKEALTVLREVYNRLAEQTAKTEKDQTVSITMTIDNLPDKISEVIKKSSKE